MRIVLKSANGGKMSDDISVRRDRQIARFVSSYYLFGVLNVAIKSIVPMSNVVWTQTSLGFAAVLFIMMLWPFPQVFRREGNLLILSEIAVVFLYSFSALFGEAKNVQLFSEYFTTAGVVIPLAIYVCAIEDKELLYENLLNDSYIAVVISLVLYLMLGRLEHAPSYSMGLADYFVVFAIVLWSAIITSRRKNAITILFAIYSVLYLLIYGNRGNLLCLLFYIGLRLIKLGGRRNKPILIMLLMALLLISMTMLDTAVSWLYALLASRGRSSYIVTRLAQGSFLGSAGRDELFAYYWGLIKQKPFFGWGVYGGFISEGSGPHNVILEILLAFGLLPGGLIAALFIWMTMHTSLARADGSVELEILLVFLATIIMKFISAGGMMSAPNIMIFVLMYMKRKRLRSIHRQYRSVNF